MILRRLLWAILLLVSCATAVKGLADLGRVIALEARAPLDDYVIYATVGRGILNGLTPYRDLFETKPPGMFLLSAGSLLVSGDEGPAVLVQLAFLAALPALFVSMTLRWAGPAMPAFWKVYFATVAFASGTLLALYLEERSGLLQSELFGSLFGIAYVVSLFWRREGVGIDVLRSLSLLGAVLVKEPFLLTLLACALLVARNPREFAWTFLVPAAGAFAGGIALLGLLGYLKPYAETYLPVMAGYRSHVGTDLPLLLRALWVRRLFANVTQYWQAPLFGYALAALVVFFPALGQRASSRGVLFMGILGAAVLFCVHFLFTFVQSLRLLEYRIPVGDPFFWQLVLALLLLLGAAAFLGALLARESRQIPLRSLAAVVAACLVTLAVGVAGGYNEYHYAFAVPAFSALLLLYLRCACSSHANAAIVLPVSALLVASVLLYRPDQEHLRHLDAQTRLNSKANEATTRLVDDLLDACGVDRYVSLGAYERLAFARHSPIGPLFLQDVFSYLPRNHPLIRRTEENIVSEGRIALVGTSEERRLHEGIVSRFTDTPPDCARPFLPIDGLEVLFRRT